VKTIVVAITAMSFFAGCGWFNTPEAYKSESGRTTFRAAAQSPGEPDVTPVPQTIPGESRKKGD